MKKVYDAPKLEIEIYQLDANIASNCRVVVTMGAPGGGSADKPFCEDYAGHVGLPWPGDTANPNAYNVNFWETNCDCYTTAEGEGFFTS